VSSSVQRPLTRVVTHQHLGDAAVEVRDELRVAAIAHHSTTLWW